MRRIGFTIIAVLAVQILVVWFLSYRTTIHLSATNGEHLVFEFHADDGAFSIGNETSRLRNTSLLLLLLIVLIWPLVEAGLILKRYLPKREKAATEAVSPAPTATPSVPAKSPSAAATPPPQAVRAPSKPAAAAPSVPAAAPKPATPAAAEQRPKPTGSPTVARPAPASTNQPERK